MNDGGEVESIVPGETVVPGPIRPAHKGLSHGWPALLVFAAALLAYSPAITGRFVWDDDAHVTRPALRSLAGLQRIWSDVTATQQFYPVLHSAFWLEHRLWGDSVIGYHVTNILLHATAACLLALVLRRLSAPGAWLAAGVFALHPVQVESVAWITEQKNTLALVFYLTAALAYLRFDRERQFRFYLLALGCFLLGLGSKTVTATLPAALLVVFWWQRGRLSWRRDVAPLIPWFIVGAMAGLFTALIERKLIGAEGGTFDLSAIDRCWLAGRVVWFYLAKLFWPTNLAFVYPRWDVSALAAWQWLFPLGAVGLLAALVALRHRSRAPLAAGLIFVGSLFPVLGFFNVFPFVFSYVADHFQYIPSIAIVALTCAGIARILDKMRAVAAWTTYIVPAALLGTLGVITWHQSHDYRDAETLYRATIARNPAAWLALNNLGVELHAAGRDREAIPVYRQAVRLHPNDEAAHNNLGVALASVGQFKAAIAEYETALRLRPSYGEAHNNLALALTNAGRVGDALTHYGQAMTCRAEYPEVDSDWGFIFGEAGRSEAAVAHCQRAVARGVKVAEAENYWGVALANAGQLDAAIAHFERSLQLQANNATAYANLGKSCQMTGKMAEAIGAYEHALQLKPDYPEVLNNLGLALHAVGRTREAIGRFESALRLQPEAATSHFNVAVCLREIGQLDAALRHYQEARRLDPTIPPSAWSQ